ncbi:hypothetical protein HI914_00337 [Erysiphe necator]|nr:hypothetical protein HI914_00337 [Erysiphe necator]
MISLVPQSTPALCRPKLSNTLRTDDLLNSDFLHRDFHSDIDSDSSSICHSPNWDDISGKKGRNEKREKQRREKDIEKERSLKMMATKTVTKPKKLSKLPPNRKPRSIELSGNGSETINNSPGLQYRANVILPILKVTGPRKSNDLGKKPALAFNSSSSSKVSQINKDWPGREFIGGLKLRKVEEAGVQETIRQVKNKNRIRDENKTPPLPKNRVPEDFKPSIVGTTARSYREEFEWQSRQEDNSSVHKSMAPSLSYRSTTSDRDYSNIPRNFHTYHEQSVNEAHKEQDSRSPVHNFKLAKISNQTQTTRQVNNQFKDGDFDFAYPQHQSSQALNCCPINREQKNNTIKSNLDSLSPKLEPKFHASSEKMTVYPRRPKSIVHTISGVGTLRPATKKTSNKASETSTEPTILPPENIETSFHHTLPYSFINSKIDSETANSSYCRNSSSSYSDIILDYADFQYDSASAEGSPTSGKPVNEWSDISSAPSLMDSAQPIKRSFDSSESRSYFSQVKSAGSSEENSLQDGNSNITTPIESRPHSFNDGSSLKSPNEIQPKEVVSQMELEFHKESNPTGKGANKIGLEGQDYAKIHMNNENQLGYPSQVESQPNQVETPRIVKRHDHQSFSGSPKIQGPSNSYFDSCQTSWGNSNEMNNEEMPLRGLIKRPKDASRSQNSNLRSDESNYSQYLKEARLRIASDIASPRLSRNVRDTSLSHQKSEPFAKMFVICCSCRYFHDMPSKLYACMAKPDDMVTEENLGVNGVITTSVKCPWCGHGMSTSCCAGYAAVVFMKERLH